LPSFVIIKRGNNQAYWLFENQTYKRHSDEWKYIFMANGGREQLFNLKRDPDERSNCVASAPEVRNDLHARAVQACSVPGAMDALDGSELSAFPFRERLQTRICQFDQSRRNAAQFS
jgi:hypothetical protein